MPLPYLVNFVHGPLLNLALEEVCVYTCSCPCSLGAALECAQSTAERRCVHSTSPRCHGMYMYYQCVLVQRSDTCTLHISRCIHSISFVRKTASYMECNGCTNKKKTKKKTGANGAQQIVVPEAVAPDLKPREKY